MKNTKKPVKVVLTGETKKDASKAPKVRSGIKAGAWTWGPLPIKER